MALYEEPRATPRHAGAMAGRAAPVRLSLAWRTIREAGVRRVLLLNVTYEPLTTVGLRRAVCLVLGEKAACSAGPAFEGGGIRCGMRADRGAVDGASINAETGAVQLSVIGGGRVRGVCGSGLIALADALFRSGWIDRGGQFTDRVPASQRVEGKWGTALALSEDGKVALWERDLASLIRAKAAVD